ncbi:nap family protein [Diplocarpon rosae]|nr:nap family protein [Diplocarpon rosae]
MPQKFAFTTAAMATALEETPVSYEELAEIERAFDDVETEIIRKQIDLTTPLYTSRQKTLSKIPNFWPLVLEQAPPDIDQYIQPSDSALLLSSLSSLSVTHFESSLPGGDPRSVAIRFEFSANEYFEDRVLEKKFWWRRAKDGWTGLVSEPVGIDWKKGKDLTGGLGTLVARAWEARSTTNGKGKMAEGKEKGGLSAEHKALKKAIDGTSMGGLSFFAWFSFIGRHISAEESAAANALEDRKREARKKGTVVETGVMEEEEGEEEEEEDMSLEIFPDGDDLAVAISDDLWPGAIKYFTQAQEQDALSSSDFESDDENDDEKEDEDEKDALSPLHSEPETSDAEMARPKKKARKE